MEFYFANPYLLWMLLPIPVFAIIMLIFMKRGKKDIGEFISFHALEFFFKKGRFISEYIKKSFLVFALRVAIYFLIVLVIADFTIFYKGIPEKQNIVIAIDASGSMLAEDIEPNRLEAVKETIDIFLEKIPPASRIAILSFSGSAYIEHDLSDKKNSLESIENIQISQISGTSIGAALKAASDILEDSGNAKLILLVSDGSENLMEEMELDKIIGALNEEHITVDVLGIGKIEGAKMPEIELRLNEPLLESIAEKTSGLYQRADTRQSLMGSYERFAAAPLKVPVRMAVPMVIASILLLLVDYIFLRLS